jgi:hypothetical protein
MGTQPVSPQTTEGSKGDALATSANSNASGDAASGTEPCKTQPPPNWTLHVLASTKDNAKGKGPVLIQAGPRSASTRFWSPKQYKETLTINFTDQGTQTFDVSASGDDWISEAPKTVTLNNGDNKIEILVLRPRPWIGFQFIDDKTTKDVTNIQLSLNLPRRGDMDATYDKGVLKIDRLDPGTGEVKKTSHVDVWSAEKVEEV